MKLGQFFVRLPILGVQESIFIRAMADEAKRSRGGRGQHSWKQGGQGAVFRRCAQSAISLMKWSVTRETPPGRAGSTRPFEYHISISLVKSDWKLRRKTAPCPPCFQLCWPRPPRLRLASSAMALIKIDSRVSGKC